MDGGKVGCHLFPGRGGGGTPTGADIAALLLPLLLLLPTPHPTPTLATAEGPEVKNLALPHHRVPAKGRLAPGQLGWSTSSTKPDWWVVVGEATPGLN